jgi:hypothetical protein
MSNPFYRYVALATMVISVPLFITIALSPDIEPIDGGLTRLSGESENDFGKLTPIYRFDQNYYKEERFKRLASFGDPIDVLIVGDSFSAPGIRNNSWPNHLYAQTSYKVVFTKWPRRKHFVSYLRSEKYQRNPPKLIIIESVEREVYSRFAADEAGRADNCLKTPVIGLAPGLKQTALVISQTERPDSFVSFDEWMAALLHAAKSKAKNLYKKTVVIANLRNNKLFSNRHSDTILLYKDDVNRHLASFYGIDKELAESKLIRGVGEIICEGAGNILFLIVPDKLTIYEQYIKDDLPKKYLDVLDVMQRNLPKFNIDVKTPLLNAVESGVVDVYSPNNTHWSWVGYEIASQVVVKKISSYLETQ